MRALLGGLSLLVLVALVGVLAKKQLPSALAPAAEAISQPALVPPQLQQSLENTLQQARPMPDGL